MQQQTERNTLIVQAIENGLPMSKVAEMFGLKAKSTIHHIYKMAKLKGKYGVRKLSTSQTRQVRK